MRRKRDGQDEDEREIEQQSDPTMLIPKAPTLTGSTTYMSASPISTIDSAAADRGVALSEGTQWGVVGRFHGDQASASTRFRSQQGALRG